MSFVQDFDVAHGTLPAGFQFGAYVIGGCIGQGGMARIYRAEHRVLHKPVALKVMEGALLDRPDGRPRFLREGQAAAAVKHPNVVDITDVGVWQGRPYLVMELLEGEDLEQYLSRHKPLAEHDVARIMIPVIAGLATAHAAGVIHRDLKPSNVFLARGPDREVVPKLLDFGISKLANALRTLDPASTPLGELMGSPMYMSPEAVRGARDLTPASDQYSLGVMLYECITGRPPFYSDSLLGVLEAVAHGHFEPPRRFRPELSTVLEGAILRAMSRDPGDRFPSVRELGRALCEAADQRTRLLWTPSFGLRDLPFTQSSTDRWSSQGGTGSALASSVARHPRRLSRWQIGLSGVALLMLTLATVVYWRMPVASHVEVPPHIAAAARAAAAATLTAPSASGQAPSSPSSRATLPAADPPPAALSPAALSPAALSSAASASPPVELLGSTPSAGAEGLVEGQRAPAPRDDGRELAAQTSQRREAASPAGKAPPSRSAAPAVHSSGAGSSAAASSAGASGARAKATAASATGGRRASATPADERESRPAPSPPPASVEAPERPDDDEVVFPVRAPAQSRPAPVLGANQSPILD
jgi:serine/threonine protein kinase